MNIVAKYQHKGERWHEITFMLPKFSLPLVAYGATKEEVYNRANEMVSLYFQLTPWRRLLDSEWTMTVET